MHYIKTLNDESNINGSDDIILRLTLEIINSIYNFMILNCKFETFHDYGFDFFYKLSGSPTLETKNIELLLNNIKPLKLESNTKCNITDILLLDLIDWGIGNVVWTTEYGKLNVEKVIKQMKYTYNFEVIFWYQTNMFKTIMKLFFTKVLQLFETPEKLPSEILEAIRFLYTTLFNSTNLPTDFIKCLTLLLTLEDHNIYTEYNEFVNPITKYIESLNDIEFKIQVDLMSEPHEIDHVHSESDIDDSNHDIFKSAEALDEDISSDEQKFKELLDCPLKTFLTKIKAYIIKFLCFMQFFDFQLHENNKLYVPFRKNPESIKSFVYEILNVQYKQSGYEESNNISTCEYVINLYSLCFEANTTINYTLSTKNSDEKKGLYNNVNYIINIILDTMSKSYNLSLSRNNLIHYIIPLIEMLSHDLTENLDYYGSKRLVYVMMTALNKYTLEYCNPPQYNFLLFNNYNFDIVGQLPKIKNNLIDITNQDILSSSSDILEFYKLFILQVDIFESFKNINFTWKGETKNISEIYLNVTSIVVSPYHIYDFFNLIFKFIAAALYYDLQIHESNLLNNKGKIAENICQLLKTLYDLLFNTKYPKNEIDIFNLIEDYLKMLKQTCDNEIDGTHENYIHPQIKYHLKNKGVIINFQTEGKPNLPIQYTEDSDSTEDINAIDRFRSLLLLLSSVQSYFFNLFNFP